MNTGSTDSIEKKLPFLNEWSDVSVRGKNDVVLQGSPPRLTQDIFIPDLYAIKPIQNVKKSHKINQSPQKKPINSKRDFVQIRESNVQHLPTDPHQRYIDYGSSRSQRDKLGGVSNFRLTKKSLRHENDSILSNEGLENTFSLQSNSQSPYRKMKGNDSPFLRISDLGNSAMGGDSNLFSQIK